MTKTLTEEEMMTQKVNPTDKISEVKVSFNTTYIAQQVLQNLPEASMCLTCTDYAYGDEDASKMLFTFEDEEEYDDNDEPKKHEIRIADAEKGVALTIEQILGGKLFVGGLTSINDLMDLGNWDAEVVDAVVQNAIFRKVIYG